jgi:uncharacterized protein YjbI with pentapeptide repeats
VELSAPFTGLFSSVEKVPFVALDLRDSSLERAKLTGALFDWVRGPKGWVRCDLGGTNLKEADLRKARFVGSRCSKACFDGARLGQASLRGCNLRGVTFHNADLSGADLQYAELLGADLSTARLDGVQLANAVYDDQTRFPEGFRPPAEMKWRGKRKPPSSP